MSRPSNLPTVGSLRFSFFRRNSNRIRKCWQSKWKKTCLLNSTEEIRWMSRDKCDGSSRMMTICAFRKLFELTMSSRLHLDGVCIHAGWRSGLRTVAKMVSERSSPFNQRPLNLRAETAENWRVFWVWNNLGNKLNSIEKQTNYRKKFFSKQKQTVEKTILQTRPPSKLIRMQTDDFDLHLQTVCIRKRFSRHGWKEKRVPFVKHHTSIIFLMYLWCI